MEILYRDDYLIITNKPAGMLVHKTNLAADVKAGFAVQTLRDMIGRKVFPVHRLDRPTSGVLVFALDELAAKQMMALFASRKIDKEYLCVVRGYTKDSGVIDQELLKDNGQPVPAKTSFVLLRHFELPVPNERFDTTRYSLLQVHPESGRMHQIRRHFAKKRHYLIGDTTYGDLKANRAFSKYTALEGLMLHASKISFDHPVSNDLLTISADAPDRFQKLYQRIGYFSDQ